MTLSILEYLQKQTRTLLSVLQCVAVVFHSFELSELLIFSFAEGLSVSNFPWRFFIIFLFWYTIKNSNFQSLNSFFHNKWYYISYFSWACIWTNTSHHDFLDAGLLLTRKATLNQEFQVAKYKSCLRKFDEHHHELIDRHRISVSNICTCTSNTTNGTCRAGSA